MGWLYVPGLVASNLDSNSSSTIPTSLDVSWKGKPIQQRVLSRECKKASYLTLLCGPISKPLMAESGMKKYISSLAGIHVNLSRSQENRVERLTNAIFGPRYFESLRKLKLPSSSLKTLQTTSTSDLSRYVKAYESLVTGLKQDYSARKKWEQIIGGRGSSSWPTNRRTGKKHSSKNSGTQMWATLIARDWKDGANLSSTVPTNSMLGRQSPRSGIYGTLSLTEPQNLRLRLNPIFGEWLMGFPTRWSLPDTEPNGLKHLEMLLSRWSQHMRSMLYLLIEANK